MIELSNPKTWDIRIRNLLDTNRDTLYKEYERYENYLDSDEHYHSICERPCTDFVKYYLNKLLEDEEIRAYHCTRCENESLKEGIKILNAKEHIELCIDKIRKYTSIDIIEQIEKTTKNYDSEGYFKNRENMIWFVLSKEMTRNTGCINFYKYFGGEVLRRITYDFREDILPILSKIGSPKVIEFNVPITNIQRFSRSNLIDSFIQYSFNREKYIFQCESFIRYDISREDIVKSWNMDEYWV